jgi:DNA-binding NarL/FixJ family response regulator
MHVRPRVLLADDHEAMALVLSRVLSRECEIVGVVGDGGEVVDAAARLQPAVIVVDVNLPNVNGLDVCRAITRANPLAKVLIMTAMIDDAIKEEALAAGASGFFNKSVAGGELLEAIKRAWTETAGPR